MKIRKLQSGFSLVEVLMAVGILMVGMMMVAGTFPVGIHLTAVSTEQTIAAVVADEAFAKIQLYDVNETLLTSIMISEDFNNVSFNLISPDEFLYPSDSSANQVYNWSAVVRPTDIFDSSRVQVTVFVSRKVSAGLKYYKPDTTNNNLPIQESAMPVPVGLYGNGSGNKIEILSSIANPLDYVTDESVIVAGEDGKVYKVIEIYEDSGNYNLILNRDWESTGTYFWVVPPPVGGGKSPCIGVYQKVIEF